MPSFRSNFKRGSITLYVLIMMIVFVIITSATIQFVSRQSHQTTDQEQEEQAFALADAGVQYVLWLLTLANPGPPIAGYSPADLTSNEDITAQLTNHVITDADGVAIGKYSVNVVVEDTSTVHVKSIGRSTGRSDLCQVINATYKKPINDNFRLTAWDHEVGYNCPEQINGCDVINLDVGDSIPNNLKESSCTPISHNAGVTTANPAHFYKISGNSDTDVQIEVASSNFTPHITLIDINGDTPAGADSDGISTCDTPSTSGACFSHHFTEDAHYLEIAVHDLSLVSIDPTSGKITDDLVYELSTSVSTQCNDGDDNDGDGLRDAEDPGCWDDPSDFESPSYNETKKHESDATSQCQDEDDNDEDNTADFDGYGTLLPDPGCESPQDYSEYGDAQCDDGKDNDGDDAIDYRLPGSVPAGDSDCEDLEDVLEGGDCSATPIAFNETISDNLDILSGCIDDDNPSVVDKHVFTYNEAADSDLDDDRMWIDLRSNSFDTKLLLTNDSHGFLSNPSSCSPVTALTSNNTCLPPYTFRNLLTEIKLPLLYQIFRRGEFTVKIYDEGDPQTGGDYTLSVNKCETVPLVDGTTLLSGTLNSDDCVVAHDVNGSDVDSHIDIFTSPGLANHTIKVTSTNTNAKPSIYALSQDDYSSSSYNFHGESDPSTDGVASLTIQDVLDPVSPRLFYYVVVASEDAHDNSGDFTYSLTVTSNE